MAAYSLESYKSQEGFSDDFSVSLPDDVIYASLRRKAEQMCIDAALAICTELTGNNLSSTPTTKALAALTPRMFPQSGPYNSAKQKEKRDREKNERENSAL